MTSDPNPSIDGTTPSPPESPAAADADSTLILPPGQRSDDRFRIRIEMPSAAMCCAGKLEQRAGERRSDAGHGGGNVDESESRLVVGPDGTEVRGRLH